MRINKFRCFNIKEGKFMVNTVPSMKLSSDGTMEILETKDVKVSQFTGLLDKNGKEIYEDDLIEYTETKAKSSNKIRIVVGMYDGCYGSPYESLNNMNNIKIIGNKYESRTN